MKPITRVLSLQPYYGGSHVRFHQGWVDHSQAQWTTLSLPPRHWKWRMRHASIYFAEEIERLIADGQSWDIVACTDMLNVAELKGLVTAKIRQLPLVLYFHENQFAYPTRKGLIPDQHFPFTNFISALAADRVWFNSQFNFDSMLDGLQRHSKRWPDFLPDKAIESLSAKVEIQPPGIVTPPIDLEKAFECRAKRAEAGEPIHIIWAARWEHDKNPELFLESLKLLHQSNVPFRLSVVGQSFRYSPPAFKELRETFADRIDRWGYQPSRNKYWQALAEADVFVSTANHEFFGLAAAEAIAVGLNVLLPSRLAYPELVDLAGGEPSQHSFFYEGSSDSLSDSLQRLQKTRTRGQWQPDLGVARRMIERIGWNRRAKEMDRSLQSLLVRS